MVRPRWHYDGCCEKQCECKGFCGDNELYLKYNKNNKLAVGLVVGQDSYLKVTKTGLRTDFTGQVKLQTGEIGDI